MIKGLNSSKNFRMPLTLGECVTPTVSWIEEKLLVLVVQEEPLMRVARVCVCVCVSRIFHLFTLTMIHTEHRNFEQHFVFL